jgi:hypothetical protein
MVLSIWMIAAPDLMWSLQQFGLQDVTGHRHAAPSWSQVHLQ